MHRLFVGIDPPEAIKDQLIDLMGGVAGARWQSDEQLHLTLRFIGEVDRHQANDVVAALASLHAPRFELSLAGVGTFDKRGQVNALWAGVTPHMAVHALHKKIDQAMVRVGLEPEHRAYQPHITLARFGRDTAGLDGFVAQHGGLASAPFAVDDFCLYESELTNAGSVYTIVERYRLD
ncbi:RNA 2',3'-cyclic phosphodiesterase [Sphingoaurantiacus capsulatus]|uniref:RNA 2',3'-cyclic phosphodiesterase n=1 Tax=Sphingoaurantiacus capsulatus TaxID=1771310 RepID=A0ABV7X8E0_9SPHN